MVMRHRFRPNCDAKRGMRTWVGGEEARKWYCFLVCTVLTRQGWKVSYVRVLLHCTRKGLLFGSLISIFFFWEKWYQKRPLFLHVTRRRYTAIATAFLAYIPASFMFARCQYVKTLTAQITFILPLLGSESYEGRRGGESCEYRISSP